MTRFDLGAVASGVNLDAEGIWRAAHGEAISYPPDGNAACLAVEDSSFWFRHRNRCIEAAVSAALPSKQGFFLDVGAGNGYVARGLMQAGYEVVAVEPGLAGARNAKARGLPHVICATTQACRFAPNSVPAAGAFDVVEHIADDIGFLSHLRSLLRADGALVLTVPAHPALWSHDDDEAGHQRRYTAASLSAALESACWRVDFETYFFRWLPLPIALMRALPYRLGKRRPSSISGQAAARDHAATRPWTARAIERALASEVRNIRQRRRMAFGGSLLAIARPAGVKAG
jgi:SAM-dependent methyltransferase